MEAEFIKCTIKVNKELWEFESVSGDGFDFMSRLPNEPGEHQPKLMSFYLENAVEALPGKLSNPSKGI
jgi:hypothetical protein